MDTTIEKTHDISWLGKRLRVYVDTEKNLMSRVPTNYTIHVTVVGIAKEDAPIPGFVIASKTEMPGLKLRKGLGPEYIYAHNQDEYKYGIVFFLPFPAVEVSDPSVPTHCKKCGYENLSGASNQTDDTYICRQCSIFSHIFGS